MKTVLAADIAPGEKTAPGARAMLGMKTVPAMKTGVCRDAADEGCSHNDTDDESSSSGNADHEDSTRKITAAGENNRPAK